MPVVELLPSDAESSVVGHLGPDLPDEVTPPDEVVAAAVARLARQPERAVKAALLDQRNLAGLGDLWADELCCLRGHSPWTPVAQVDLGVPAPPAVNGGLRNPLAGSSQGRFA